uniref:Inter-alpha-trypsin inhibitor heavy chain H3 n=1 Tax=Myripristis murdjan TaxID=586833 RepID=A0A667Z999_9TELE
MEIPALLCFYSDLNSTSFLFFFYFLFIIYLWLMIGGDPYFSTLSLFVFLFVPSLPLSLFLSSQVEVYSVTVDCTVASRFAHTVMTSSAINKANASQEIFFEVEMPKTAFITNFSMEIEGQVYVGEVKEKEKAKKQYEKAVSSGQTAGLVKVSGRKMEKFSVSVNIAANSNVTFVLTYEELLQRKLGQYEILTRVKPKQLVQNFQVTPYIYEPQGIAFVDAHGTFLSNELLPLVEKTVTENKAHISFSPTLEQQRKCPGCDGTLIDGDFIVKYDVNRAKTLGDIQIVNGYFVHFFSPPDLPRVPKNVVFVIDRSGSMGWTKMRQTREALLEILKDLHMEDYFALIPFDDKITPWKNSLMKATEENVAEAMKYVRGINSRGGTNINDAVLRAVKMLINDRKNNNVPDRNLDMIILLTDGIPDPAAGESRLPKIQENVRGAIDGNMSLFCLGFGNDVDYTFLDVMAKQNKGVARRIYEASDATLQLQGFYEEVSSPLLSEVDLRYPDNAVEFVTTNHFRQLFNGSEIVVAGRLSDNDIDNFLVEVFANGVRDKNSKIFNSCACDRQCKDNAEVKKLTDFHYCCLDARMWAYLTIQQLLEKRSVWVIRVLSYPYISIHLPKTQPIPMIAVMSTLSVYYSLYSSSDNTCTVDGDPHFMIELPEREDSLCFNINDTPGTIFNLVRDPTSGILVNGQTIGDKKIPPDGKINTYFGRFGIVHQSLGVRLDVTTKDILVSQDGKWSDYLAATCLLSPLPSFSPSSSMDLLLTKDRSLTVTLRDSVKFVILLHKVWEKHPYHQNYLGFYTLDSHLLSPSVHGLLGQFYHGIEFEVADLRPGEVEEKPDATMYIKGQALNVTRGWQKDYRWDVKNGENVPCWFVHSNGTGLIDGDASDYVVSGLFKTV